MKIPQKPKGLNQVKYGFIGGLIVPLIAGIVFFLVRYPNSTFSQFIDNLVQANIHTHVLSLSVLPNLLLFFVFIWSDKLFAARGVIGVTFIYAFVAYAIKFGMKKNLTNQLKKLKSEILSHSRRSFRRFARCKSDERAKKSG